MLHKKLPFCLNWIRFCVQHIRYINLHIYVYVCTQQEASNNKKKHKIFNTQLTNEAIFHCKGSFVNLYMYI